MANFVRLQDRFRPSRCFKCKEWIRKGAMRIQGAAYPHVYRNFHLGCYRPLLAEPMDFERDVTNFILKPTKIDRMRKWVERWNLQFEVREDSLPKKYTQKAVKTRCPPARRKLLEVFQFLTSTEIEQLAAFTCKAWFHVTRDEELWAAKYTQDFHSYEDKTWRSYRNQYIVKYLGSCWMCREVLAVEAIRMRCPFRKRPLCVDCSKTDEGMIVSIYEFCTRANVDRTIMRQPDFSIFYSNRVKSAYLQDLTREMTEYADNRRKALLEYLETLPRVLRRKTIILIRDLDLAATYSTVNDFFSFDSRNKTRSEKALFTFFGANGEKEDWKVSVEELIETLKEEERQK